MMSEQPEQLSLDIAQDPAGVAAPKGKRMTRIDSVKGACLNCEKGFEITNTQSRQKFCSDKCRRLYKKQTTMNTTTAPAPASNNVTEEKVEKEKRREPLRPKFNNISPELTITIDMITRERDNAIADYREERQKRKKIQEKFEQLKEKVKDDAHANALAGVEAAKPDFLDRILSGFSQIPAPIAEKIAGPIGNLVEKMTGGAPSLRNCAASEGICAALPPPSQSGNPTR